MVIPPHLPPPSCNIQSHHRWQRLKLLGAAAFFGLLAGLSGASMMLGWIWPLYGEGDVWSVAKSRSTLSRSQLEERVKLEVADRVATVYGAVSSVGVANYFNAKDKLAEAVIVSSDGWLVMSALSGRTDYKNWRVLLVDGSVYPLAKILADRYVGLVYLKLALGKDAAAGRQFKVVSFGDKISPLDEVFAYQDKNWRYGWVQYPVYNSAGRARLDSAAGPSFALNGSFAPGAVVIGVQGRVLGFVSADGLLLPNSFLTRILPGVLSSQKISYPSLGAEGWFSEEQPIIIGTEKVNGFMVSRVWSAGSNLLRGDVILEINGYVATADNLWYNLSNQSVKLKIWRNGKIVEIESQVMYRE